MRIKKDLKEFLPWNKGKFKKVETMLAKEFSGQENLIGKSSIYWARKKKLLKELYNIDWKTPQELNPDTIFD